MHIWRFFCRENGWDSLNEKLPWILLVVRPILYWTISHVAHWLEKVAHSWSRNIFVLHHSESGRWLWYILVQSLFRTELKSLKDTNSFWWSLTISVALAKGSNWQCYLITKGGALAKTLRLFFSFLSLFCSFAFFSLTFLYVFLFLSFSFSFFIISYSFSFSLSLFLNFVLFLCLSLFLFFFV